MKKLVLVALIAFIFFSCKKSSDKEQTNPLVGTWLFERAYGSWNFSTDTSLITFYGNNRYVFKSPAPFLDSGSYFMLQDSSMNMTPDDPNKATFYSLTHFSLTYNSGLSTHAVDKYYYSLQDPSNLTLRVYVTNYGSSTGGFINEYYVFKRQ